MPHYRLDLSYDGSGFHGFARQAPGVRTVQGVLEEALARVFQQDLSLTVAGRTDTGVHARQQVVGFSAERDVPPSQVLRATTSMLGPEVVATDCVVVDEGFSARFDARSRTYQYHILDSEVADPLRRHTTWHVSDRLDIEAMDRVAGAFVGEHDFATFCRRKDGRATIRTVFESSVRREPDETVVFEVRAKAFCHQMVRSLTGFLVEVGRGRRSGDTVTDLLAARDRSVVPSPAPPCGLVLWRVEY